MHITPVVRALIIINVVFYFLTHMGGFRTTIMSTQILGLFYFESEFFRPHQLITHMFLHANLMHLMFNMLSLYFLGPFLEIQWGSKKFLKFYFAAGLGAAFIHLLVKYIQVHYFGMVSDIDIPVIGASGAIYGIFIAFAMLYPNAELMLLFPPIPIKAKYLAPILVFIDLSMGISGTATTIAHFAHVGGALIGFIVIKYWQLTGQLYNRE